MTDYLCTSGRTGIRPAGPGDAALLARWKQDPLIRRMALDPGDTVSEEGERRAIEKALRSDGELYLIIEVLEQVRPVGYIRINWMDGNQEFAWLRFAMGESRRRGYMRESLACLLGHLFRQGMHRIDAEVYTFNEASLALLAGLGFVSEGLKREACRNGDGYSSVEVLGLLESDLGS